MNTYLKFGLLIAAIIGTLAWLALGGIQDTKTYYKTISEVRQMGDQAKEKRLRVAGDVEQGSIQRAGRDVHFTLRQEQLVLKVLYSGVEPLPDTFRDGAQAVADGRLDANGVFHATRVQAKCASKYEAKPGPPRPAARATL